MLALRRTPATLPLWLVAPAAAVALVAGVIDVAQWLRTPPLWLDEEMIALNVRDRSFMDLAGPLWLDQSAPLGWIIATRLVVAAFGTSELVLRLIPLLFGLLTLAAAAWIGTRWMGRAAALLLVLLCALAERLSQLRFEAKHYSADAFWALVLPALAAWAVEPGQSRDSARQRALAWWIAAALGQWFSNGAILVTPGCALFLVVCSLRRQGRRGALSVMVGGAIWLASFGVNYDLSLQYTRGSAYLRSYWSGELPADSLNAVETVRWISGRLAPLAENPGSTSLPGLLWTCALCGFTFGRSRPRSAQVTWAGPAPGARDLAVVFSTVPLSAFVLAAAGEVPLADRLSLWIMPAVYVGLALAFDAGLHGARDGWATRSPSRLAAGAVIFIAAGYVSADIITYGYRSLDVGKPGDSNHRLDDRSAVRWMMQQRRPGDALMTTQLGWPAIWWYGGIPLNRGAPHGSLPDGSVMYRISHETGNCGEQLRATFDAHRRALVYAGFPDVAERSFDAILRELAAYGTVVGMRRFADLSIVAVVERRVAPGRAPQPPGAGCVSVTTMRRW